MRSSWIELSFLQDEQAQPSQAVFIAEVLLPCDCGSPPHLLSQVHGFPVLEPPEVDAALQVGSQQTEGQNPLPHLLPTLLWMQPRMHWGSRHTLKQSDGCGTGKKPFQYSSILYIETSNESELVYYKRI